MARRKKTIRNSYWYKRRGIERRGQHKGAAFQSSGRGPNREVIANYREHTKTYPFARNTPLDPIQVASGFHIQEYMDRHQRTKHMIVKDEMGRDHEVDTCPPQIRVALRLYWQSEFNHGIEQCHMIILYQRSDGNVWTRMYFWGNNAVFVKYHYGTITPSVQYHSVAQAHEAWSLKCVLWQRKTVEVK